MNSVASQSSSSGCDGGAPCVPKSSLVSTMPRPKNCSHARLTATRAVSGLSLVDQPARQAQPVRHLIVAHRLQRRRRAGVDPLALVHEAAAPTDERRRPLVAGALAHHERSRDAERLELLLQLGDAIARAAASDSATVR